MTNGIQSLRINEDRFKYDFEALAKIGRTIEGGVHRPALSEAHLLARDWFCERILEAGLEIHRDSAGNHSALLKCGPAGAPTLLLGSHLDSVPFGGRFDGALGVLAALEVLRSVSDSGISLRTHLEAIDFTDEEGTLVGLLGSAALAGRLEEYDLANPRGGRAEFLAGLARADLHEAQLGLAARSSAELAGYLELHIEQGPKLMKAGAQIGVVAGIVGICSYKLAFLGRADHAGTTPLTDRLDAALGAASFILGVREIVGQSFRDCVANIGWVRTLPGAFNIVPSRAELHLEMRAPEPGQFQLLEDTLIHMANEEARSYGLNLEVEFLGRHQPTVLSPLAQDAIRQAAMDLGLKTIPLPSGAGHDAQMLAQICPAGMIFIPSAGGSHSWREFAEWEDCCNGANVLLQAALILAA